MEQGEEAPATRWIRQVSARVPPAPRTSLEAQTHGLVEAWRRIIDQAAAMASYEGMRAVLAGSVDLFAAGAPRRRGPRGRRAGRRPAGRPRDQVVGQLLHGMTGPPERTR